MLILHLRQAPHVAYNAEDPAFKFCFKSTYNFTDFQLTGKVIKSQYILDIFNLAFDDHPESDLLREQIPFLTLTDTEHTGIGAFIHFSKDPAIVQFQVNTSNATNFDTEGIPTESLDGIEIRNPELSLLADAIVWLKNGFIDHLEIFNKCGEDYVKADPEHYHLEQMWLRDKKRRTIIR